MTAKTNNRPPGRGVGSPSPKNAAPNISISPPIPVSPSPNSKARSISSPRLFGLIEKSSSSQGRASPPRPAVRFSLPPSPPFPLLPLSNTPALGIALTFFRIVPDFRSTDGLFKSLSKKHNLKASGKLLFDAAVYQDENLTASFQDMVRSLSVEATKTEPTAFHHMLARLAQENRLTRLYTQNIDAIESSMEPLASQIPLNVKAPWPRTIQLHGSLEKMVCQKCRHLKDFDPVMFDRPDAPECPECTLNNQLRVETGQRSHGIGKMRPRIVLYNEHNPDEEAITSVMNADVRSRPDALIVVGTSLKIPGVRRLVKSLCHVIRSRRNGMTMWINNEPPVGKEFESCWDLMVKGDCDKVAELAALKRWDDSSETMFQECNSEEMERAKRENELSVVIGTPRKAQKTSTGFLTPSSSHDEDGQLQSMVADGTRANPASRGPSIKQVLTDAGSKKAAPKAPPKAAPKAAPKKAAPKKAAPRKRTKKEEPAKNARITTFSKVTKGAPVAADKSVKLEKDEPTAMHPLPPGAARNNGPMLPHQASKGETTPTPDRWRQPETISPKSVPNGMGDLLSKPVA